MGVSKVYELPGLAIIELEAGYGGSMAYIIGCFMASLSFLINRAMLKRLGPRVIVSMSPAVEELAKTGLAYWLDADILVTHMVFGLIEAIYDYRVSGSIRAAAASITGHAFFGAVTVFILSASESLWLSWLSACAIHICWNVSAVLLTKSRKDNIK